MKMYQLFLMNVITNQAVILKTSSSQFEIIKLECRLKKTLEGVSHAQLVYRETEIN